MTSLISVFPEGNHKFLKVHAPHLYTHTHTHTAKVANNLSAIAEHYQKTGHNPDADNIKVLCREDKLIPRKVIEAISIKKETSPTFNRDGGVNFQKCTIPFCKHRDQHLRQVSEEDQSVAIQLPPTEDGDGYHRNIRIKNVSAVD